VAISGAQQTGIADKRFTSIEKKLEENFGKNRFGKSKQFLTKQQLFAHKRASLSLAYW